LTLSTHSVSCP